MLRNSIQVANILSAKCFEKCMKSLNLHNSIIKFPDIAPLFLLKVLRSKQDLLSNRKVRGGWREGQTYTAHKKMCPK